MSLMQRPKIPKHSSTPATLLVKAFRSHTPPTKATPQNRKQPETVQAPGTHKNARARGRSIHDYFCVISGADKSHVVRPSSVDDLHPRLPNLTAHNKKTCQEKTCHEKTHPDKSKKSRRWLLNQSPGRQAIGASEG